MFKLILKIISKYTSLHTDKCLIVCYISHYDSTYKMTYTNKFIHDKYEIMFDNWLCSTLKYITVNIIKKQARK